MLEIRLLEVVPFVETEVVPASERVSRVEGRTSQATSSPPGKELSLSKRSRRSLAPAFKAKVTSRCRPGDLSRANDYAPRPVSDLDLAVMRRMDASHVDFPIAGARVHLERWRRSCNTDRPHESICWPMTRESSAAASDIARLDLSLTAGRVDTATMSLTYRACP